MSPKERNEPSEEEFADFVPAVFARSVAEAEEYRELLNDHDIPAIVGAADAIKEEDAKVAVRSGMTRGVPVLVPEVLLDEASEVIADREDADEFGDEAEDEEEDEESEFEELGPDGEKLPVDDDDEEDDDEEDDEEEEELEEEEEDELDDDLAVEEEKEEEEDEGEE